MNIEACMRAVPLFLLPFVIGATFPIDRAVAAPAAKPLSVCVSQSTGVIKAKTRCGRGEKPLSVAVLQTTSGVPGPQGPKGDTGPQGPPAPPNLNVFDGNGKPLGPLVALGQVVTEIDGAKYLVSFTSIAVIPADDRVFFSLPDCAGTAYAKDYSFDDNKDIGEAFSGIATIVVSGLDNILYLPKLPHIGSFFAHSFSSRVESCHNLLSAQSQVQLSGYELVRRGPVGETFVPPFDVHE